MGRGRRRPAAGAPAALAVAVLVLAAGCTVRLRPDPVPPPDAAATTTTVEATVRGTTVAARAYVLRLGDEAELDRPDGGDPLAVGLRALAGTTDLSTNLLLVFPLLRAPPDCVRQVVLWLRVLARDRRAGVIAAYPSLLVPLAAGRTVAPVGGETLVDNRPRGTGTLTGGGTWMRFDLTDLYRTWASGGPFPSRLRRIPRGTPLVVDIRPESFAGPAYEVRFSPLGGDRQLAPQLRWRVARGC